MGILSKLFKKQKEENTVTDEYFFLMNKIEENWGILYNSKDYKSELSEIIKKDCLKSIDLYKKMITTDPMFMQSPPQNVPAYTRLAMIYEKRKEYDKAIEVCTDALLQGAWGNNMAKRLERMIKKADRKPTKEELELIERFSFQEIKSIKIKDKKEENYSTIDRKKIPAQKIDEMQKIEASEEYKQKIYSLFYSDYPNKPFISKDREMNTNWIEQAEMFPKLCIIPKTKLKRFNDGLLPGHIYMLYWLKHRKSKKRIPSYFEYKYGINFEKEKMFLSNNGYLDNTDKPTLKGEQAIKRHFKVIENH